MIGLLLMTTTMAFADAKTHKIAFHVDESDPKVIIELVAHGPGMKMFVKGKSPVEDRISVGRIAGTGLCLCPAVIGRADL